MLTIKRVDSTNPDFQQLIKFLDFDLNGRYAEHQKDYDGYNKVENLDTAIVAYINDVAVGCGCFKVYNSSTIEIKRMYVLLKMRGKGIAKKILRDLEVWGIQLGYKRAILETGIGQPEAIGLYKRVGYSIIPNYDQYAGMPNSVCMGKNLALTTTLLENK